jgi:hypothetical protein
VGTRLLISSCISCFGTQLSFADIADTTWQNYGIVQNVDILLTVILVIICHYGQMLTLLTLLTPIYGKKQALAIINKNFVRSAYLRSGPGSLVSWAIGHLPTSISAHQLPLFV